jgi:hypothetical protein
MAAFGAAFVFGSTGIPMKVPSLSQVRQSVKTAYTL